MLTMFMMLSMQSMLAESGTPQSSITRSAGRCLHHGEVDRE